jgi:hypothetical protein
MTAKQIDAWFAKLDRFADVPFMRRAAINRRCRLTPGTPGIA